MSDTNGPSTSVIIPVYNDPAGLKTTVESVLDQSTDDYEVVVADNGSTDRTQTVAREYATRDRVTHVVEDEHQGSYAARNAGIEAASGDLLSFIDADMWVEHDWVVSVQDCMAETPVEYLGCAVEIVPETETVVAEYNARTGFPVKTYLAEEQFAPTCCLTVDRAVVADVGPFDAQLVSSGDAEFGKRVARAGYTQGYAPEITMYHPARDSLAALLSKHYRIARGQVQRARYHPDVFDLRHPLNPLGFLPVRPTAVADLSRDDPPARLLQFYAIMCAQKLTTTAGRIAEWLRPTHGA